MRKQDFQSKLIAATHLSWRFAKEFSKQKLPAEFIYDITTDNYPEHALTNGDKKFTGEIGNFFNLDLKETVNLIWLDSYVPAWIDIAVTSCTKNHTYFHLRCAGRCAKDESRLMYYEGGNQPFGIKSPDLPPPSKREKSGIIKKFNLPSIENYRKILNARISRK